MPTPFEILIDPVSIIVLVIFGMMLLMEAIFPGRKLPKVMGWYPRAFAVFITYFYLSTYLPLFWDKHLSDYQLFNLESLNPILGAMLGLLVLELMIYLWHRSMHKFDWLWRSFHQMHHSAERIDTIGAFYFSPLDMIGFSMLGSLSMVVIVGVSPQAATYVLISSIFLAIFQHTNIKTPQWIGYFIQRPESHSLHHGRGIHRYNYSDLPVFDIIFGTFKNPEEFVEQNGFYDGASSRISEMLLFRDVSTEKN